MAERSPCPPPSPSSKAPQHDETRPENWLTFFLASQAEQRLIDMKFARWSVRAGPNNIRAMKLDYRKAAQVFAQAMREGTAILEGREP